MDGRALLGRPRLGGLLLVLALLTGCNATGQPAATDVTPDPSPTIQPDDVVNLTVYFRQSNGTTSFLEPVTREVEVTEDLPRTAVELLLEGPTEAEGASLEAPLPATTRLRDLTVEDDTATVDLSAQVIRDADEVGASADNEFLALAALSATLTEFPAIERVHVLVEGENEGWRSGVDVAGFWGSWGLPALLVRDDSVIGPPREGDGVPDVKAFTVEPQERGDDDAEPVRVTSIRVRHRTTYVRLTVEIDSADSEQAAAVPVSMARSDGDGDVVVDIADVTAVEDDRSVADLSEANGFAGLQVEEDELPGTLRLRVEADEPHPFLLHTLSSPTRIVVDIRK